MKDVTVNVEDLEVEGFEGKVKVEVLKFRDRLKYSKMLNFKTNETGEVVVDSDMVGATIALIEVAEKHILKMHVKHIESGVEVTTLEEMEYNPEFDSLIPVLASLVLNAGRVGKN